MQSLVGVTVHEALHSWYQGVLATNAQLVEKAVTIVENLGAKVIGPDAVRDKLHLTKRPPAPA